MSSNYLYHKYQKYKQKYLQTKYGGGDDDDLNILIVVDVQNCFIQGGSMGSQDNTQLQRSIDQIKEIETLIDENELIIFTRDFHPTGHKSFIERDGLFEPHCRNNNATCYIYNDCDFIDSHNRTPDPITLENLIISKSGLSQLDFNTHDHNLSIIGTDISYLFLATKYRTNILELIEEKNINVQKELLSSEEIIKKRKTSKTIGLTNNQIVKSSNNHIYEPLKSNINYELNIDRDKNKYFYQLTKGEYCDYESYSAFNYHLDFTQGAKKSKDIQCDEEYTTGLCEFIEHFIKTKNYNDKIPKITVCGLVGNVCVMHTVHQGLIMTKLKCNNNKNLYPHLANSEFYYSCPGTLWLSDSIYNRNIAGYFLTNSKPNMEKDSDDYYYEKQLFEQDAKKVLETNKSNSLEYTIILNDNVTEKIQF